MRTVAALVLLLLTAGCATSFPGPVTAPDARQDTGVAASGAEPASGSSQADGSARPANAATAALLAQSRVARGSGDYAQAAIAVERALSIDSNDASLWIELAEIRFAEGDANEARTLAQKALTLAGTDRSITARADRIARR